MPVVPDLDSWLFDFYHCMGSYFCVEGGLFRSAGDIAKGLMNVVFPALHQYNVSSVTKVITNIIRASFPYGVPDEVSFVSCVVCRVVCHVVCCVVLCCVVCCVVCCVMCRVRCCSHCLPSCAVATPINIITLSHTLLYFTLLYSFFIS